MYRSLNFVVETEQDVDNSHPRGFDFARELRSQFALSQEVAEKLENWRDVGWCFQLSTEGETFLVTVSCLPDTNAVVLQVSPAQIPNMLLRLFGSRPSATDAGMIRTRVRLEEILNRMAHVAHVSFAYDRFPVKDLNDPGRP